ncbi:MAG: 2-C-methyl-D-erythritol 2,4-cyclodiphosphate synthase [Oscillospiraceae bacterium]|nr:2-C-methyl-D-erythritol 2,4-cyclodiphosphate synthase [Oscillospiraceae bacterium]
MECKAAAIIAAGGKSSRMNGGDKLFADLGGIPVLIRAVSAFQKAESIGEIIIAVNPEKPQNKEKIDMLCRQYGISKLKTIVSGGRHRQESVLNAINEVGANIDVIAVQDGARPFVSAEFVNEIITLAREKGAVIPAVRVKDTIKSVGDGKILATPDRAGLYAAQTPQTFVLSKYFKAIEKTKALAVTDDASLFEKAGIDVFITEGDYQNIKITTPEDLKIARGFIGDTEIEMDDLRIGTGYDVHKFGENRKLILCGVEIPHEEGLLGHSDADVAVHALMDALLGALALGDIGKHFPDSESEYKGISSLVLLARVIRLINQKGYKPSNLDITIIAEKPKLAPYIFEMRENIAGICQIPIENVSLKATTEEGLGLAGKGIGANAICMVKTW